MSSQEQADPAIRLEIAEGYAIVSINNALKRNALTIESARLMLEILSEVDRDREIGALVVRGEGGNFCSGADLSTLGSMMVDPAGDVPYRGLEEIYGTFSRLKVMLVPTIAAVRGFAVGAGLNLALAADLRIISESARLMSGFAKNGLLPGGGHSNLISSSSSHEAAVGLGIFSEEISGKKAEELGLAWQSLPDSNVEGRALELARIAAKDPEYSRMAVKTLRATTSPGTPWDHALQIERAPQIWSFRRESARR